MMGIVELLLLGAAVLVIVKLSKSGTITVHNEKFNRFADKVDQRAGDVLWRGRNARRNSLIAAGILALLVLYYPSNVSFFVRLALAIGVVVLIKRWTRPSTGENSSEDPVIQNQAVDMPPPHAAPAVPDAALGQRHLSRPIPPIPRLRRPPPPPPQNTEGFFSVILPAFGVLCLLIGGGFALLVTSGEFSPRVRLQARGGDVRQKAEDRLAVLHEGRPVREIVDEKITRLRSPAGELVARPSDKAGVVIGAEDPIEYKIDQPRVDFITTLHSNLAEAQAEVDQRITAYLRDALSFELGSAGISKWRPAPEWVARHFIVGDEKIPHEGDTPGYFRLKVGANFDKEHLELAADRFEQDQSEGRTWLLAKAYAGTISILGGLAIVLRLGTGVAPGLAAGVV